MGTTQEWIDARRQRSEWIDTQELRDMMLDDSDVGPYALLVHSGCGDGALICGDGAALAMYLSRAAVQVFRHTGVSLSPPAFRAGAEALVNAAANDVLCWLRRAGIEVDEGSAIASVVDLLVNVVVCRAKSHEPVSVEVAVEQSWPDDGIEAVLGWCAS